MPKLLTAKRKSSDTRDEILIFNSFERLMKNLTERIVIDPDIMVGKPVIKGTRITVALIIDLLSQGMTVAEILEDYPHLKAEDIYACLAFAKKALESSTFIPVNY